MKKTDFKLINILFNKLLNFFFKINNNNNE